ncbi:MAG: hypothetical protein FJ098_12450, partial [Deltaproteobacteria bacterium]|nr:hypothetical protein [Deltaproteobacteria bacterium]
TCAGGGLACLQVLFPSVETCDAVDEDCNGVADDGDPGGGAACAVPGKLGPCAEGVQHCQNGVEVCNQVVFPAAEDCDGVDDNCNGVADEGDPGGGGPCQVPGLTGACAAGILHCQDGAAVCTQVVFPGVEDCDAVDNDCDGAVDDGNPGGGVPCQVPGVQGPCAAGVTACQGGMVTCSQVVFPVAESCDGEDNDCDGAADDGDPGAGVGCAVPGKLGPCGQGIQHCQNGAPVCVQVSFPAPSETCNGVDDNCNGGTDEGDPGGGGACLVPGLQGPCATGVMHCQNAQPTCTQTVFPQPEDCDTVDDDCDGVVDDGNPGGGGACAIGWLQGECAKGQLQCQGGQIVCSQVNWPQSEGGGTCNSKDDDCNGSVDGQTRSCSNGCYSGTQTCTWGSWSACSAQEPACSSGACCDGCNFKGSSVICDSTPVETAWQCTSLCGGQVQRRYRYKQCTGSSASCGTGNIQWEPSWTTTATCAANQPCQSNGASASCQTPCGAGTQCTGGNCVATCGDNICAASENPSSCPGDCAPVYLDTTRWRTTNGSCSSTTSGWHPAGGIVYWTFGTSCSLPSVSSPESYAYEFARWTFTIKKAGTYRIRVKIPPTGSACNFASTKYSTGVRYIVDRPGDTNSLYTINQRNGIGSEVTVTDSISLGTGELRIYVYDSVTDLSSCCDTCGQSLRVFLDYAKVEWLY